LGCYQQKNHGAVAAMTEDPSDGLSLLSETLAKKKIKHMYHLDAY